VFAEFREINPFLRYFKKIHSDPQIRNLLRQGQALGCKTPQLTRSVTCHRLPSTLHGGRMVDSQSPGRENSGRFAQHASQVGFLFFRLVSKPLLTCPQCLPLQCNGIR
jgi:hypothetical protein